MNDHVEAAITHTRWRAMRRPRARRSRNWSAGPSSSKEASRTKTIFAPRSARSPGLRLRPLYSWCLLSSRDLRL